MSAARRLKHFTLFVSSFLSVKNNFGANVPCVAQIEQPSKCVRPFDGRRIGQKKGYPFHAIKKLSAS
jgi:hypothetical protein